MPNTTPIWKQCVDKSTRLITTYEWDEDTESMTKVHSDNPNYKRPTGIICQAIKNATICMDAASTDAITTQWNNNCKEFGISADDINDYLDIIPFTPSIMLNLSPNWKGLYHVISDDMEPCEKEYLQLENLRLQESLCELVESYMSECSRFDYYDYIIECGSEGNHLHAHVVAHVNPKLIHYVSRS